MRLRGGTHSCVVAGVHGAISAQRPRSSRKVRSPYRFSTNESSGGLYGLCSRAPGLVGKLPTPLKTTIPSHGGVLVLHGVGADRSKRHLSQTRMGTLKKYQSPPYAQERPLELLPFTPLSNPANAPGPSLRSAAGAKFWMRQNLRLALHHVVVNNILFFQSESITETRASLSRAKCRARPRKCQTK